MLYRRCSIKKLFSKISQYSQENNSEYCEIFKNTYFEEYLQMAASHNTRVVDLEIVVEIPVSSGWFVLFYILYFLTFTIPEKCKKEVN